MKLVQNVMILSNVMVDADCRQCWIIREIYGAAIKLCVIITAAMLIKKSGKLSVKFLRYRNMKINGQYTAVQNGSDFLLISVDGNLMITLNPASKFLFDRLSEKELCEDDLVKIVCDNYHVSLDTAAREVHKFIEILENKNIIA